jgi:hypothetical protein
MKTIRSSETSGATHLTTLPVNPEGRNPRIDMGLPSSGKMFVILKCSYWINNRVKQLSDVILQSGHVCVLSVGACRLENRWIRPDYTES